MYDIFYVSQLDKNKNQNWQEFKLRYSAAKYASSVVEAQKKSLTKFFWAVWDDLVVDQSFKFDYEPDEWSKEYIHVFKNNIWFDGICLFPKKTVLTQKEIDHRFFVNKKEIDIVASMPRPYDVFEIDSYEEYLSALETSTTELFWMTSRNITATLPDVYFDHSNTYDRTQNHAFIHRVNDQDFYNGVFLCSKYKILSQKEVEYRHPVNRKEWNLVASIPRPYDVFEIDSYEEYLSALENSSTEMFWIVPNYVTVSEQFNFDTYFTHNQSYERSINHVYLNGKYHDGIVLCSKQSKFSQREFNYRFIAHKKEWPKIISMPKSYDVVFISYQEPNADENYKKILKKYPKAKRINGVKGIHQAHIAAAKLCKTDMFWIVDGDAVLLDDFDFEYQVARWDQETVHVWRSQNPINDLVYGYGGVKLFPRQLTINMDTTKPDMTTSISSKFKVVEEISNITAFNTDPFNTWKSAFRECAKLSSGIIDRQNDYETNHRLMTWTTIGKNRTYGEYAIEGANAGRNFGLFAGNKINLINDFDWLKEQFNRSFKED